MKIELVKKDIDYLTKQAIETGQSDDLEVIEHIAEKYPDVIFFRHDRNGIKEIDAETMLLALDYGAEVRPR